MFNGCSSLTAISVGDDWSTASVTSSAGMFTGCNSLVGGNGTVHNSSYTDKTYARVDADGTPGYLSYLTAIAYVAFTEGESGTLTFYYDKNKASRSGTAYSLNSGTTAPGWNSSATSVTKVVFNSLWSMTDLSVFINGGNPTPGTNPTYPSMAFGLYKIVDGEEPETT
jgi:hypothetical protein